MYMLIPPAGSNTGLYKIANVMMIPILLILLESFSDKKNYVRFFWIVITASAVYSVSYKLKVSFEDKGLLDTNVKVEQPGVSIYTTADRAHFINEVCSIANNYKAKRKRMLFVGTGPRFFFEYIYGYRAPYRRNDFWLSLDSEEYANPTYNFLYKKNFDVIFVIPNYEGTIGNNNSKNLTENKIKEFGYQMTMNKYDFRVYEK